ncbi:molybdate ABC transporter permease subunit [Brachyspira pilosicoli]|mgnify:CR=1 FL=1|uniref:Molybdenum transport system permease n=4 Tax=Brachyspira pilosicoli TaxID=52584 RepID=D8IAI6_BRAP9|nr:molybdate ABC transporter permease subunit [Brachyspira pilosicoli]ADK30167.1 molybdenum transport system permease protein [Brachyspira pilosicoli 95/1000]AFR70790.1 molybdenum transport system permease [Brachyspira pilosicoli B2904]MBW5383100.1 molybdate ABC transporter permease subunit [Brachyspira pilosicoli]MBW5393051.1 molybdate ABC transporter permease subunit [Brachyspira pilosicoli]MBW5398535.1 molybdate ABC transporter permease subunit [Brachyspira pilosicoli]
MEYSPLILSLKTAFYSTIITFFVGIYIAFAVFKIKRFSSIFDIVFTLPLVLPPTVVGFFLLIFFGRNSFIGSIVEKLGFPFIFTLRGAILASFIVSFPLMYRTSKGAFEQIDTNIINAARTLGKSENWIFWRIMLPNSWQSILGGAILSFTRALGEFGATIMIAGNIPNRTQTISLAIYTAVQAGDRALAFRWVIIIVAISFISIMMMNIIIPVSSSIKKRL